jgi:hypothetical protein
VQLRIAEEFKRNQPPEYQQRFLVNDELMDFYRGAAHRNNAIQQDSIMNPLNRDAYK